jgi:CRP/FNR family transcriptional regulator
MNTFSEKNKKEISTSLLQELKETGSVKLISKGEVLLQEDAPVYNVPVVLSGAVKVSQTDEDKEMLLYYLKEGDMCMMSFLGGLYSEHSKIEAVADKDSEILLIPVHQIGKLLKTHPEWTEYIFDVYHRRFNELLDVIGAVAFKKMDERLLAFIRRKSEITGTKELEITHEELARELGTARVVVSRLLKELEKKNIVSLARNRITLV